ncbi:MAG: DUF1015 family protein [Ramlibacter sp.]|nr:DUF1015 family protein [Ramlibacter sp.]
MTLLRPFTGLRPAAGRAQEVIAPPYDVLDSNEARKRAEGKPWSFLHISKAEIDLPAGTDPYSAAVYDKARENLDRMLAQGVLERDAVPGYYIYRLVMGSHIQTGIVAAASVPAYEDQRIRRHEFTRPDKEDDRVRQIDVLNAQTGPVFMTYRQSAQVDALVTPLTHAKPDVDVTADDGVRHILWVVNDAGAVQELTRAFSAMDRLYIADGHHRSAAAARVAAARRARNPQATGEEAYEYFLSVNFPDDQVKILDYNRAVKDLNGLSPDAFLARVREAFDVSSPAKAQARPAAPREFGMYLQGKWYRLRIRDERVPHADPVRRLDISLLQDNLLSPLLGIGDPRTDKRIDFIGGIRGLAELERRVDSGEMAVAFALFATSLEDLMAVADAGEVMPPKSTWFEPKLADGLVSHVLD